MASLLSWGFDKLKGGAQTLNRDILNPTEHAAGNVIHAGGNVVNALSAHNTVAPVVHAVENAPQTFNNDVVQPINRDVIQPVNRSAIHPLFNGVNRDVVRPVLNTPQIFTNDVLKPISRGSDQINPFDNGRTWQQRTPTNDRSMLGQLTHNGVTNVTGDIAKFGANLTGIPAAIDASRLGVAELTHNKAAKNAAEQRLANNLPQFIPIAVAEGIKQATTPIGNAIGTAIAMPGVENEANKAYNQATQTFNNHTGDKQHDAAVNAYAAAVKDYIINSGVAGGGVDPSLSKAQVAKMMAGAGVGLAGNFALGGELPALTGAARGAKAVLGRAGKIGATNAITNVGTELANNPTTDLGDLAKTGTQSFVAGATMTLLPLAARGALTPAVQKAAQGLRAAQLMRPANLSDAEVANIAHMRDISGTGASIGQDAVFNTAYNSLRKVGINPLDTTAVDRLLGEFRTYATRVAQRKQTLNEAVQKAQKFSQDHPIGLGMKAVDENGNPIRMPSKSSVAPKPSTTISAVKTSNGGAVSASEVASVADGKGRSSVGTPSKPLQQVSHAPNLKSDLQAQSDLRIVEQNPAQLQEQSQVGVGEQRLVKNPSSNSTPRRGFIQSVNKSGEVSPIVAKRASGTYKVRDTKKLAQSADKFASGNISKATEAVSSSLAKKRGAISDREVANAIAVAKRHDANHNYAQATDIYENLSKHLTAQGQSIQAASLLDRRTPEGIRYAITKEFKKHNITPSKETLDAIESKMGEIKKTKPGTPERILATKQLQKIVADQLPSNLADKGVAFWKAGLLTGARTQSGNLLSNETFSVLHNISNPLAAGLDKGISLVTGRRTKTLTGKGLVSGTNEGFKRGATYLKTGIDERAQLTNKFDSHQVNFKNKALNTYVNGVFRLMGAADRPHYYRQLQNSLADLATADGKNLRLKGQALRDHVNNFVKNPPQEAFQVATNEAEKSVLANDTILSKAISKVREVSENAESPLGKAATEAAINLLMPFTRVPSAFISRVVDYTPVGAIKTIAGQISRGKFNQRDLVTAISEAGTGTGLMYLGAKLAENNMLSGDYPSEPKEQQRWKAEGIQPNSIKVAGKWINMNYAGPLGLLFGAGARIADTKSQGGSFLQQQAQAYAGLPKDLTQQSFLQGLSGAMQAINEPGQYLNNYEKSQAGSIIPTLIGDVATATDSKQRQADNPLQTIKSRIPGVRETLNPAQDIYGNPLPRKTGPLSSMINPLRPTTDMSNKNPVVKEVNRLHNVDPNNSDLQVTPIPVPRTLRVKGNPVHLSSQQRYDLQKQVGQTIQSNWSKLISTPEYKALSDIDKAKALSNLRTDSTTLATRTFVTANNLATYNKAASSKVIALDHGTADMSNYTASAPGGSGSLVINKGLDPQSRTTLTQYKNTADRTKAFNSTPAAEYQYDQAKYQNDLANGTMTPAKKIRTQKTLQREKVGSTYPKNVRDLYSLSNAELYDYLTTSEKGVDKAKTAKQLIAYDQALYNAGIEKSLKFKTGIAPSSGGSGSRSSKYDKVATANLKFALAQKPLKIVGALPAPSKTTGPKFITPALKTVYQKKAVNTHPTVSVTKTKHP